MPIFDQGYQHWSGKLSGHAWRWLAIARRGVRIGITGRFLRMLLLFSWVPAIALAAMLCLWGLLERRSDLVATFAPLLGFIDPAILADPKTYRAEVWTVCYSYFLLTELRFSMVLILLVGPNLISQDLRYNALPLYLSRPLRRIDYFLGKLGVIAAFIAMVIIVPSLIAYVLGLLFSLDITILRDTFDVLLASIAYGLMVAISAGMLVLALSSLSRNSRYVALAWLAVWFGTGMLATILEEADREQRVQQAWRVNDQLFIEQQAARELEYSKTNWRPLVSYVTNLSRVGEAMLGTNEAWERLSMVRPQSQRSQLLLSYSGPRYPWYWSAAVLAALFGLSACILNYSIKSLDRLK